MSVSLLQSQKVRPLAKRWTKARIIVFLRMMLIIATSYLLLVPGGWHPLGSAFSWLIIAALASNIPFVWLPRTLIESTKFGGFLIVVDTAWITGVLFYSGYTLVTTGPYQWVRHSLYVATALAVTANSLVTANSFLALTGGLGVALIVARTQTEEEKLVERFSDEYRTYMDRTGRFFPRLRRQGKPRSTGS